MCRNNASHAKEKRRCNLQVAAFISNMTAHVNKKLRYRGEHSASNVGTNRKLICDFLLMINTNLLPILHIWPIIGQIFASDW